MSRIKRINLLAVLFWAVALADVVCYGSLHWQLIWTHVPVTVRESGFVVDVRGYLDPEAPVPFSPASIPSYANGYGPGFLWAGAPFQAFLPFLGCAPLRLASAFYLILLGFVLFWGLRRAPLENRAFAVVLTYAIFVSSPSVAAGPDIIGGVLYCLSWLVAIELNFSIQAIVCSVLLALLAGLTKPYFLLAIPALASFLFLFKSIRIGFIYCVVAIVATGTIFAMVSHFYPLYFLITMKMQSAIASRYLWLGLNQWGEFVLLVPVPTAVAVLAVVRWIRRTPATVKPRFGWREPLLPPAWEVTAWSWGAFVAFLALAALLSWHAGAHLIYFWHLFLPLLLLAVLNSIRIHPGWLFINLTIFLLIMPPMPVAEDNQSWDAICGETAAFSNVYFDPFFQALRPPETDGLRENTHGEVILSFAIETTDPQLGSLAKGYVEKLSGDFRGQSFDCVVLANAPFVERQLIPIIKENYGVIKIVKLHPYYLSFRRRWEFGRIEWPIYILRPRKSLSALPSGK